MTTDFVPTLVAVALLALLATAVLFAFRVPARWAPLAAIAQGAVQLAIVSVIPSGVISHPVWIAVALVIMLAIASTVASRRMDRSARGLLLVACAMGAGVIAVLVIVIATGAIAFEPRYVLAIGSILIGNSMSIATLTGRKFASAVSDHWGEVEGWLALGATPRSATRLLARDAVREALIPATDQTRTTGLVVLPGAFIGAIFGGLSPIEAGRFQIVVLAGILAAGAVTAALVAYGRGGVLVKP